MDRLNLVIVMGLPGTGKSTFARSLSGHINAIHLNTDKIRMQLGRKGLYDMETKSKIYHEMLSIAKKELKENRNVIVDATFSNDIWRKKFNSLEKEYSCQISWIVMEANEDVIKQRVSEKRQYSEADFSVYKKIRNTYEPLSYPHLLLNSDRLTIDEQISKTLNYLTGKDRNTG